MKIYILKYLYSKTLRGQIRGDKYIHLCSECKMLHVNNSLYFDRDYICNNCLGRNSKKESKYQEKIYFIESQLTKLIKIGISGNPKRRIKEIEKMQGGKINILKIVCGTYKSERYIHTMFSHLKTLGEWFKPEKELLDYIKNI
jgi:hypothetical protein